MRTMRRAVATVTGALAATLSLAASAAAQQPDPYYETLHFGTGLIETPVAWVSPNNADAWFAIQGVNYPYYPDPGQMSFASKWNTNVALDTHWFGRLSVGAAAYSQNPNWGIFGQLLLLRDNQFGFLPAISVGARNIGPYKHEDRYLIGDDITFQNGGWKAYTQPTFENFHTSPTLYAVATKNFVITAPGGTTPMASMSLSVGGGNGIFSQDGGLGARYNKHGTLAKGLFLGGRAVMHPSLNTTLSLMAENDGWDWNAGLLADWRGITFGVYGKELEEGSRRDPASFYVYNYRKFAALVGYSGNIIDISRGVLLRTRITDLAREQQQLRFEIASRERRIKGLEVSLRRAQAGELARIGERRQELEKQVQEERDAIQRAQERLRQLQEGKVPGVTPDSQPAPQPNPPSNPPSTPPSNPQPNTPPSGSAGGSTGGTGGSGTPPTTR